MGVSTRPSHNRRQTRSHDGRRLAAFIYVGVIASFLAGPAPAAAATTETVNESDITGSIPPSSFHEVAITAVSPGMETATFTARLTDQSLAPAVDVAWRVRNAEGEIVHESTSAEAHTPLSPGYYTIEARYGAIRLNESFTLLEGNSVTLNFTLNAGGLRILPRIKGITAPAVTSRSLVYALTGKARGKLVTESGQPGEIINLAAGQYRIESRLGIGNAVAVTDVRVKPGIMSSIDIDHRAGLARLSFVGAPSADVTWDIREGDRVALQSINGLTASVVLRPGDYTVVARVGDETLSASFRIDVGEERDIMLGN